MRVADPPVPVPPEACTTMAEVRAGVDALDARIVALLAMRFRFMDAAARIKPSRDAVRDEARKAAVIAHAQSIARAEGVDAAVIGQLYDMLVEASIKHEFGRWERLRA